MGFNGWWPKSAWECVTIIARGGRYQFEMIVFGDEPYGNYNRILLSSVLAGTHDPKQIFLNPLEWYAQNGEVPTALRHLRAVGDRDRAAALLGTMLPALCTHGASSVRVTVVDGRVTTTKPATSGCIPR